jgi:UV excision repair protein RAD23
MRIQIRTLNQSNFDLNVESTMTIEKVKELIEEKTHHPKAYQVLIFAGKLLSNDLTLESANVREQDFLVLMPKRQKTGPASSTQSASEKTESTSNTNATSPPTSTTNQVPRLETQTPISNTIAPQTVPSSDPESAGLYTTSSQTLVTGEQFQVTVDEISSSMGFPKDQVALALRASFGNPDRAVEYLLNGDIPVEAPPQEQPIEPSRERRPTTQSPSQSQTQFENRTTATPPRVYTTGGITLPENIIPPSLASQIPNLRPANLPRVRAGGVGGSSFEENPMLALRELAQSNPQAFQELLTQLVQANPQLGVFLSQHRNEFMQLLNAEGGGGNAPPSGFQLHITPRDQESLERLVALGFSRNRAIEAYFLFEKSEEAAANFLLNSPNDDEELEFLEGDMEEDDETDDI